MRHPDDFDFYLECGCRVMDHLLGKKKMPEGYHLLIDSDGMYFFWMEKSTGRESCIHWDKWAVYRGAHADAKKARAA